MKLTIQQIKDMNIRDIEEYAREYDDECDGVWDPICVICNRDTKKCEFFDDWSY